MISMLASETYLTGLKSKVHNLDVDKLKTVPTDLSKLSMLSKSLCMTTFFIKTNAIDAKYQALVH